MDYNQFKRILENGANSKKESINELLEFVNEFPYFQTAHAMLAKVMHEQQHVRYERQLKKAAAYSGDRKSLYSMIHPGSAKLFTEKTEDIEKSFIPKTVVEEEKPFNIFVAPVEPVIPPVEEFMNEDTEAVTEKISEQYEIAPAPVSYMDDMNYDEMEPEEDYDEPQVADPHDIIRRRLNEILGFKEEFEDKNIHKDKIEEKAVEVIPEEVKAAEVIASDVSDLKKIAETETERETETETETETGPKTEVKTDVKTDALDRLAHESKKVLDVIDKGELEYALEATLIQSLEKLPLIEKPSVKEKVVVEEPKELTFYQWLKLKSDGGYGIIEEVHAYDEEKNNELNITEESSQVKDNLPEEPAPLTETKAGFVQLIDRFIESDPKIIPSRTEFYSPVNQAKKSITENEDIVSETLAKIYQQQGNLLKARSTYQRLSLLNPEKLTYFAALISDIDKKINNLNKQDL